MRSSVFKNTIKIKRRQNQKMKSKKFVALIVSLFMIFSCIPMYSTSYAQEEISFSELKEKANRVLSKVAQSDDPRKQEIFDNLKLAVKEETDNDGKQWNIDSFIDYLITVTNLETAGDDSRIKKYLDQEGITVEQFKKALNLFKLFEIFTVEERIDIVDDIESGQEPTLIKEETDLVNRVRTEFPDLEKGIQDIQPGFDLGMYAFVLLNLQNKADKPIVKDAADGKISIEIPNKIGELDNVKVLVDDALKGLVIRGYSYPGLDNLTSSFENKVNTKLTDAQLTKIKTILSEYDLYIVDVTGVTLDKSAALLVEGQTEKLTATISPDNATNKNVIWSSDNTDVATVDANGLITAVAPGKATITVTTVDGNKTAACEVTVTAPVVTLNPIEDIQAGTTITIAGNTNLTGATIKILRPNNTVLWTDTIEGDFSKTITIPADAPEGIYTVVAGKGTTVAIQTFTVTKAVVVTDKNITGVGQIADINVENGTEFDAIGLPTKVEVTLDDGSKENLSVTWDKGNYDGNKAGTYELIGTINLSEGITNTDNLKTTVKVIVAKADVIGEVTLNPIEDVQAGSSITITGSTTLIGATIKVLRPNNTVLWTDTIEGDFSKTITIPADAPEGIYTVAAGKGTIVAIQKFKVTKPDEVIDKNITGVTQIADINVENGTEFDAIGLPEEVEVKLDDDSVTNLSVEWEKGNYDGNKAGEYTLEGTIKLPDGITNTNNLKATVKVTVTAKVVPVTGVTLNKNTTSLVEGQTEKLTATISPDNATNKNVIWGSSDETIATVDNTGKVTGVKAGKATIAVITADGNFTATCKVTIIPVSDIIVINKEVPENGEIKLETGELGELQDGKTTQPVVVKLNLAPNLAKELELDSLDITLPEGLETSELGITIQVADEETKNSAGDRNALIIQVTVSNLEGKVVELRLPIPTKLQGKEVTGFHRNANKKRWEYRKTEINKEDQIAIFETGLSAVAVAEAVNIPAIEKTEETSSTVKLTWNSTLEEATYEVYKDGKYVATTKAGEKTYTVTGLDSNKTYKFQVRAIDKNGFESALSDEVAATTSKSSSSSGGGGGGGGGGGSSVSDTKTIKSSSGGSFEKHGANVEIPKNAFDFDNKIEIKIEKVSDTSKLSIPEKMKLASNVVEITKNKEGDFKKAVTITLEYDKNKFDADKYDLAIYWLDEEKDEKDEWNKLDNISVDKEKGTVSGEVNHFTKFAVLALEKEATEKPEEPTTALTDIKGHWAEENIAKLILDGAISGYPDKTFKPNNNITRAEFATVLVKAFKLENKAGKVFTDTKYHWAKDFIATAAANGIVSGYDESTFGPNDLITREQMAVMIAKVAELTDTDAEVTFTDSKSISNWAKSAVAAAAEAKIISGYPDGTFKPQGKATRAEAVTVIVKAMEK